LKRRRAEYHAVASAATVRIDDVNLRVVWTNSGIAYVESGRTSTAAIENRIKMRLISRPLPKLFREALEAAGRGRADIGAPIDLTWAREYEREVLFAAMRIPRGQTRPYSWLAREARRPLAVRAAASAIARNPLWLLVPCHRVISADGTIGNYGSSGIARKRALLAREGVHL
jgi:O-6-methylguanine DNA methyltransferase